MVKAHVRKNRAKEQQLHTPSPLAGLFYHPGYSTAFSWDAYGYDNATSLETECRRESRVKEETMFTGLKCREEKKGERESKKELALEIGVFT